jgi:hypothetical protein
LRVDDDVFHSSNGGFECAQIHQSRRLRVASIASSAIWIGRARQRGWMQIDGCLEHLRAEM